MHGLYPRQPTPLATHPHLNSGQHGPLYLEEGMYFNEGFYLLEIEKYSTWSNVQIKE